MTPELAGAVGKQNTLGQNCTKGSWNRSLNAADEDKGDISEEVHEDEDELHAWCLLEESESEQWQEVISKKSKLMLVKLAQESLPSVEKNSCASPRKVIEVKDSWVDIRHNWTLDLRGHVMPAENVPASETGSHERKKKKRRQQMEKGSNTWVGKLNHSSPSKECTGA